MRICVFSDVHGNLPAFELMLKDAGLCDHYICLGDLINYGPWSNECVDLALSLKSSDLIMGNHEEAFINGNYPGDNPLVQEFFKICYEGFKKTSEIREFRQNVFRYGFNFQHTLNHENIYPDTKVTLDANYVIGHTHYQFTYRNNGFILYNAGSVGQNRKYINEINYLIMNGSGGMELCSVIYDVDVVIDEMKKRGYPAQCLAYYQSKARRAG